MIPFVLVISLCLHLCADCLDTMSASSWNLHPGHAVNAPHQEDVPLWGSYRPGLYFGLKQQGNVSPENPFSAVTGLMWGNSFKISLGLRHDTQQDQLTSFEWTEHDGKSYGKQKLVDNDMGVQLQTQFVSFPPSPQIPTSPLPTATDSEQNGVGTLESSAVQWAQRITVNPSANALLQQTGKVPVIVYIGLQIPHTDQMGGGDELKTMLVESLEFVSAFAEGSHVSAVGHGSKVGHFELLVAARPAEGEEEEDGRESEEFQQCIDNETCVLSASFIGFEELDAAAAVQKLEHGYRTSAEKPRGAHGRRARTRDMRMFDEESGDLNNNLPDSSTVLAVQVLVPPGRHAEIDVIMRKLPSVPTEGEEHDDETQSLFDFDLHSCRNLHAYEADGSAFTSTLSTHSMAFHTSFDSKFGLSKRLGTAGRGKGMYDYADMDIKAAQAALSSTLGGVGFFYGTPLLGNGAGASDHSSHTPPRTEPIALLTATPSRTAFPRGFLWDEGFHQMLIIQWDTDLCMRMVKTWLEGQYEGPEGHTLGAWLPREMILGDEAQARVPREFVTQNVDVANPPTLLLVIRKLLNFYQSDTNNENSGGLRTFLVDAYKPLHNWVRWFSISQRGEKPGSYRWRGRSQTDGKVIPNTLASGLDDYPRSAFASDDETHLDLHCWMIMATGMIADLEEKLSIPLAQRGTLPIHGNKEEESSYADAAVFLKSQLNEVHWSTEFAIFTDIGLTGKNDTLIQNLVVKCGTADKRDSRIVHIPVAILQEQAARGENMDFEKHCPDTHPNFMFPIGDGQGGYSIQEAYVPSEQPEIGAIPRIGYNTIFPLLLKVLDPTNEEESAKINVLLEIMEHPALLWTPWGLRSIASTDLFYHKRNAPGDAPYWRGPIWIPINYLALSALHHYSRIPASPVHEYQIRLQQRADTLYRKLRKAVVDNVLDEYHRTGFFWEHYDDETGKGTRGHPFTGWTALVANMMAEKY